MKRSTSPSQYVFSVFRDDNSALHSSAPQISSFQEERRESFDKKMYTSGEETYQSEAQPLSGFNMREEGISKRKNPWKTVGWIVALCCAVALGLTAVRTVGPLELTTSSTALLSQENSVTSVSEVKTFSEVKNFSEEEEVSYNLTLYGRLFYNETECLNNDIAFASESGYKEKDAYVSNGSSFALSAPPNVCFSEDTMTGGASTNYFMLKCETIDGEEKVVLKYFESPKCEIVTTYEYFSPSETTCVEAGEDDANVASAAQVLASSCSGVMPEESEFYEYPHSHLDEKKKFIEYAYENRKFLSQRLEDKATFEVSDEAKALAAKFKRKVTKVSNTLAHENEAYRHFKREFESAHVWEYAIATYPGTADITKDREAIVEHFFAILDDDETGLRRLEEDYESWNCVCLYVDGSGSFLFWTFAFAISDCRQSGKWGEFEESSVGVILGLELGAAVGAGTAYFRDITDVSGVSYTFELGGLIETGIDVDVTFGTTYATSSTSADVIGVYAGLSVGLSVGGSAAVWTRGECFANDWSGFSVPSDYSKKACFPGSAIITLADGHSTKRMDQLQLGDVVRTVNVKTGQLSEAPVYLFGHRDLSVLTSFVAIETSTERRLLLSPGHFLPTLEKINNHQEKYEWAHHKMMRAKDIQAKNHVLFVVDEKNNMVPEEVTKVTLQVSSRGLFNPFTRHGAIIVDGVVASEYSEWFLDAILPATYLPATYHAIQAPLARVIAPHFPKLTAALDGTLHQGPAGFSYANLGAALAATIVSYESVN